MAAGINERIPPHNDDAEKAVLGAILIDPEVVADVRLRLRPEDFYSGANKRIYEAVLNLSRLDHKPDLLTLKGELEKAGKLDEAGGADYIAALTNVVPSSANADYYAQIVQDCSLRRGIIQATGIAGSRAYEETSDARLLLEETQERLFSLSDIRGLFNYKRIKNSMTEAFNYLEKMNTNKAEYIGIPSGFDDLDRLTLGFQKAEFIVIGARPGMGKTAIALTMAVHASMRRKIPSAFFSLEMSDQSLMLRILSGAAQIDSHKLRTGFFDSNDMRRIFVAADEIVDAPLFIVDMPHMTILDIQAMARMLRLKEKVEIIFIDYIGLIGSDNPNHRQARYELISEVSRSLKGLARELDIPIVALSQLRREAEKEKQPNLSDIRESGSIEQDADMVMFINRDRELDKTPEDQIKEMGQKVQLILAKNRNGPVGTINLTFLKQFTKFASYAGDK
jgi:replicative DNA helicase